MCTQSDKIMNQERAIKSLSESTLFNSHDTHWWSHSRRYSVMSSEDSLLQGWVYCLLLNRGFKSVSLPTAKQIWNSKSQLWQFSLLPINLFPHKETDSLPSRDLICSYIKLGWTQSAGKTAAQLNFWHSSDCATHEKRRLNNEYVTDQTSGAEAFALVFFCCSKDSPI